MVVTWVVSFPIFVICFNFLSSYICMYVCIYVCKYIPSKLVVKQDTSIHSFSQQENRRLKPMYMAAA